MESSEHGNVTYTCGGCGNIPSSYRAVEILQTSATVAAIALALATLMQDQGPAIEDVRLIPVTLLLAGFVVVISSGYAAAALHAEMGLTISDLGSLLHDRHSIAGRMQ